MMRIEWRYGSRPVQPVERGGAVRTNASEFDRPATSETDHKQKRPAAGSSGRDERHSSSNSCPDSSTRLANCVRDVIPSFRNTL
jgi:hypothetical protein